MKMNWSRLRNTGNEHVFKGSQLVTSILERHSSHFRSRAAALKFCRQLFNDGVIRGVFGATTFEDSVQLYTWHDQNGTMATTMTSTMTSPVANHVTKPPRSYGYSSADVTLTKRELYKQRDTIKPIEHISRQDAQVNHSEVPYTHDGHNYCRDAPNSLSMSGNSADHMTPNNHIVTHNHMSSHNHMTSHNHMASYQTSWNLQRASTASSESSVDILSHSYGKYKDKNSSKSNISVQNNMVQSRDHDVIPEEAQEEPIPVMERTTTTSTSYETSSFPRSVTTDTSANNDVDMVTQARWQQDYQNSYSDNEKQLIEQMKRMKKEHSHILRTYEDRINKLMAKMHELRSIAEMLENSSTKSSPYGMIPKNGMLNFLNARPEHERKVSNVTGNDGEAPPPLPPRPGRGNRLNPNKPYIQTDAKMKNLAWSRIILKDESGEEQTTIWHTMMEPKLDAEEVERLFSTPIASQTDGATLYDDLIIRRGRSRQQLVSIYDTERSKKIVVCMKCLRATLTDIVTSVSTLDTSQVNHDGLAELMELLSHSHAIDKILYHVRKKGAGHLDHPEYLVFELSKVDHFKNRLEFIRFRFKLLWHLFEIEQQLRELHTACDEITNSISLKNLLETVLVVGNYLNGATEMGQADGYGLDVLNKMKELQDRDGKGTLLEFVLKTYCQIYENEVEIGCPTRFRLPEPSNMRHAAQVSFEVIQDALSNLHSDLRHVREKLLDPAVNKDTMRPMDSFRVIAENFFASALEVIGEQEKVLQDTRDVFDKTTAYYRVEQMTPQKFFQIWALFLHDCKYFWKLAHRRLAKERFELEFKYKGQVSASSLQGYGTFRAGVLQGNESNVNSDPKTSTAQRKPNRWAEMSDNQPRPNVPPKPSRTNPADTIYNQGSDRSSSPKPLTSNPPSSVDVRKPLPKTPAPNPSPPNVNQYPVPNYENQSELDRYQQQPVSNPATNVTSPPPPPFSSLEVNPQSGPVPPFRNPELPPKEKKSQQFSLRAWLKREKEQVRKGIESDAESTPEPKGQSSRPFSKFKNSMIQKFSSGSNSKKQDSPDKRLKDTKQNLSPQSRHDFDTTPVPYDVLRNNYHQRAPTDLYKPDSLLTTSDQPAYPSVESEQVISPIDDPDAEDILASVENKYNHQNGAPPQLVPNGDIKTPLNNSDVNNNEKFGISDKVNFTSNWQSENESPYGRNFRGERTDLSIKITSPEYLGTGAESKCVIAHAAPVYKARVMNNYENQGKFENPHVIRQQAEPVKYLREQENNQSATKSDNRSPYSRLPAEHNRAKSSDDVLRERQHTGSHSSNQKPNGSESSPYGKSHKPSEKHNLHNETPRKRVMENRNYLTPGNRVPMNVQSIGSLIDKFDKYNNNSNVNEDEKPGTMTSTPVAPRKAPVMNGEVNEASPPLPPRSPSKSARSGSTPNDNSNDSRKSSRFTSPDRYTSSDRHTSSERYTSPDRQSYYTPQQTRTSNHLNNSQMSPPSVYSTPQGGNNTNQVSSQKPHTSPHSSANSRSNSYLQTPAINSDNYNGFNESRYNESNNYQSHMLNNNSALCNSTATSHANNNQRHQADDRDDGYRARLRRAANTQSAFDRYTKGPVQYTGRPSFGLPYDTNRTPYGTPSSVQSPLHNNEEVSYMAI